MGIGAAVFESAGCISEHYIPGVYTRNNIVSAGNGISSGNVCILGESVGGKPHTLLVAGDKAEAKEQLLSGSLLEAVSHAFSGSRVYTPQYIYFMRVNPATPSQLLLQGGGVDVLKVTSSDYGAHTNSLKLLVKDNRAEGGGYSVSVSYKGNTSTTSNISRPSFSIRCSEAGTTGTITIDAKGVSLKLDSEETATTIAYSECELISDLVTRINETDKYNAIIIDSDPTAATSDLDYISNIALGGEAVTIYSDLSAIIAAIKKLPYIGSVELVVDDTSGIAAPRNPLDDTTSYLYFTLGSESPATMADWIDALAALETYNIQIVTTPSTNSAIHSLIADHCTTMSSTTRRRERTFIVGMPLGTTIARGIEEAKLLNTHLGSVIIDGATCSDPLTGSSVTISPAILACKMAGIEGATSPSVCLTNKALNLTSITRRYVDAEYNRMIAGGLMPFGTNDSGDIICIRAMTSYQGNSLIQNERSMVRAMLYMDRDLRNAFAPRIGTTTAPSESEIIQVLSMKGKEWLSRDLVTDGGSEPVFDTKVKFVGDKIYITYSRYIRAPTNFIFATATNMVYTSTTEI